MSTDFEQLRREAYDRGRRDAYREYKDRSYKAVNPYAGFATDEAEYWNLGYTDEAEELAP